MTGYPEPIHILILESNHNDQGLLAAALTEGRPHVSVTVVGSVEELDRAIQQSDYHCIVIDDSLLEDELANVLETTRHCREACPTLVISATRNQDVVIDCIRGGCVDFVPKHEAVQNDKLWQRIVIALQHSAHWLDERRSSERRERHLLAMAETDTLTGLANRRHLQRSIAEGRWRSDRRQALGCILLDVDHFKQFNDTYGHSTGDAVLKAVAQTLRDASADSDTAVRWGGEEMLVLSQGMSLIDAWMWAERIREQISQLEINHKQERLTVTASFGVNFCLGAHLSEQVIDGADEAMYMAKQWGRNQVCTTDMVHVVRLLDMVVNSTPPDPELRRAALLHRIAGRLGPTQWSHVSDQCEQRSRLAVSLAKRMDLPARDIESVRQAALVLDIGKCLIPEQLLNQPRELSANEWQIMDRYRSLSLKIVDRLGFSDAVRDIVRHQHQSRDVSLTPAPIDNKQIGSNPLAPQVLAVACAAVAMLNDRCHRPSRSPGHVIAELRRGCGHQFSPQVVDHFTLNDTLPLAA